MIGFLSSIGWTIGYLLVGIAVVSALIKIHGNSTHNLDTAPFFLSVCLWPLAVIAFFIEMSVRGSIYMGKYFSFSYQWVKSHLKKKSDQIERVDPEDFQFVAVSVPNIPEPPPIEEFAESATNVNPMPFPPTPSSLKSYSGDCESCKLCGCRDGCKADTEAKVKEEYEEPLDRFELMEL